MADGLVCDEDVRVPAGPVELTGRLCIPESAAGIVVFAHGSGSSRHSTRNRYVAGVLNDAGFATLLFDLLTSAEERDRNNVFDIDLLASRLVDATGWLAGRADTAALPVGYFGASTGAAAALVAVTDPRVKVGAVVSRVGGRDEVVLELNRIAQAAMPAACEITIVPGATHVFEEPGTLERVAVLARNWFVEHLRPGASAPGPVSGDARRSPAPGHPRPQPR